MHKLIVLMIDGVSADYFLTCRHRLPHLSALADRGFHVERLHSVVVGASLAGRTSMITGVTGDISCVYGNVIWDGTNFRLPTPDDVQVQTIAGQAHQAGRDVAVLGFGMIRPDDASMYFAPHWVGSIIKRIRNVEALPQSPGWQRAVDCTTGHERFKAIMERAGIPSEWPSGDYFNPAANSLFALQADHRAFEWAAALAVSDDSPDLIFTEIGLPDSIQHRTGYKSEAAHWAIAYADSLVGNVIQRLHSAGKLDEFNIAVIADHGHATIERSIRPERILSAETRFQAELSLLHVVPRDEQELVEVAEKLAPFGVLEYSNAHIPVALRDRVFAFIAPDGHSFEQSIPMMGMNVGDEPIGAPLLVSSHGLQPGHPGDDRLFIMAGPDVPRGVLAEADAEQAAPTFARMLGLPLECYPKSPVF